MIFFFLGDFLGPLYQLFLLPKTSEVGSYQRAPGEIKLKAPTLPLYFVSSFEERKSFWVVGGVKSELSPRKKFGMASTFTD